ncbi:hypothetical protein DL766_009365 [Monosporascus sp. MC13-8B]|uniref:Glycosyl hydrolase family 95 N-terminal domain-containing protein n=1 Tax=Monosporascus cannonballus TaxID=155416 RepID=A0ABY0H0V5_9PEZI|nr:hypothetical protein DL762_006843 [Monosporascus cannonballus]RYO85724.1 hypothetical protein DL763_006980 [Monosporascus cannonballus]RYP15606.1 hypothetical protein DL766_009365 [Monosporascus sp. MC13-8B]
MNVTGPNDVDGILPSPPFSDVSHYQHPSGIWAHWDGSRVAWYASGAGDDWESALPIGNGRLGALVTGNVVERLVLKENSAWSGPWEDRVNPKAKWAVAEIRDMFIAGNIEHAAQPCLLTHPGRAPTHLPLPVLPAPTALGVLTLTFRFGPGAGQPF